MEKFHLSAEDLQVSSFQTETAQADLYSFTIVAVSALNLCTGGGCAMTTQLAEDCFAPALE